LVAREAVSYIVTGFAFIRHWDTDIVNIEDPVDGTFKANLIRPVPKSTSEVSGLSIIGWG
jgi:hypothetical protein